MHSIETKSHTQKEPRHCAKSETHGFNKNSAAERKPRGSLLPACSERHVLFLRGLISLQEAQKRQYFSIMKLQQFKVSFPEMDA